MSLHRRILGPEQRDGVMYWRSACECGWCGNEQPDMVTDSAGPDAARAEYREHVEGVLGAEAYYSAAVACKNCGARETQGVLIGTDVSSAICERCGTTMLQPDNEVWRDAQSNHASDSGGW